MKVSQPDEEKLEESQPDEEDKLLKIQKEMLLPVGLSELEKEQITNTFNALKGWLGDAETIVLAKDRLEAYRYVALLISHLQMVDVDYVAGASQASVVASGPEMKAPLQEAPKPVVRPTKEQVDGWLEQMPAKIRRKAITLVDCLKQYNDPDSAVGIDIICNHCSREEMEKCIRIADPSITDSTTVFMAFQQEGNP